MSIDTPTRHLGPMDKQSGIELTRGVNYVLAIAIDEYQHQPGLSNCVNDVKDIINILILNYAFAQENVTELYNEDATSEKIVVALDEYSQSLSENDSLIVLFSGHGQLRNSIGYWIPVDARDFPSYLPVSTIRDYLEPIKARHIFVIADACFAGRFFVPTRSSDPSVYTERHPSRYVLTSGRDEPVSDGRPGMNSPFAEALKVRLQSSTDSVGAVMLSEQVLQDVVRSVEGYQTPRHGELNITGNNHGQFFFHKKLSYADKTPSLDDAARTPIYDSKNEVNPFSSWTLFSSIGFLSKHIAFVSRETDGAATVKLRADSAELIGVNKSFRTLCGRVEFEYKVGSSMGDGPNLFFYAIPMQETGIGRTGLIEVGTNAQDDQRNAFSRYRAKYSVPIEHYGDNEWHKGGLDFDFRDIPEAFYSIFGPRINEGSMHPYAGTLLITNVRCFQND